MIPALANCWFIEFSLRKVRYTVTTEDRKNDEGAALAEAFGNVYKEMEADGTLTRLSEEYLSGTPVEGLEEGSYQ
jgi:hypothetical protein